MIHFLQPFFERKQLSFDLVPIEHSIKSIRIFLVRGGMTLLLLKKLFCQIKQNPRTGFNIMNRIMRRVTMMLPKLSKLSKLTGSASLIEHSCIVSSVAFHPILPLLATGSWDRTAKLWRLSPDGSNATCVATLAGHRHSVAFHPTAPLLVTGSGDNTAKLWRFEPDGSAATCVATLEGHGNYVSSVAFHPTAPLLATGSWDNTTKLWRFSANGSAANNMSANCVATLEGHSNWVRSVAFHPTAPFLTTGSSDMTTKLWRFSADGSAATCVATLEGHSNFVLSVAFHPTAPLLATGSWDKTAKLWRFSPDGSAANNMSANCVATLEGHSSYVSSVAFHPKVPLLATGSGDNTAKLWRISPDGSAATCDATLEGHSDSVNSVAFHPTAPLLATGSCDNTAKLWR